MRHHRRADDAEREIEHLRVLHDLDRRREAADHVAPIRIGHGDLNAEADGDDAEQRDDEGLDPAEAELLHPQDEEHVERGEDDADLERNAEQQIEADRRADHLGEVGGADGELGEHPERIGRPSAGRRRGRPARGRGPEATPSRAQSDCRMIAMMLESSAMNSSA